MSAPQASTGIRRHLTFANVTAVVALFVALGGGAYAASIARKNSVTSKSIKNGQVKNADLADNSVTGPKVKDGSLTGADVAASTLGTVPNASNADHATSADSATNANHATGADTATNAANAAQLGGQAPASFQARVSGACSSGSAIASIAAGGTVGCQSTNVTQMMGGIQSLTPNGSKHYLAGTGLTVAAGSSATDDAVGASARAGTAGDLDVGILTLEPATLTFKLFVNGNPTALSCTIPANGGTCSDSTDAVSIPAGALVNLEEAGGGGVATQIAFGWTDTTAG